MTKTRIETDSMGQLEVPADALWGAQTQRAINNFPISGRPMPESFIRALGRVKAACARANLALGLIEADKAEAIVAAADKLIAGEVTDQFPIDIYQTGSGTSSNMNANEVIAHLCAAAGHDGIHPNDHVNMSQSSNDVIPTTIQVSACLGVHEQLLPALEHLHATLERRAAELDEVVKTGRTHLMDAMPVTFGQELRAWGAQVHSCIGRLENALERLKFLPQGGTAVGTGINAPAAFGDQVATELKAQTGFDFRSAANKFEGIATQDGAVELSGQL
ncbi:MAG: lyase family protein, partial [Wenzhouxiangellaceae bacterium]|nr:lyase family protein [Wenzhouxiangellaceae bacterium]